ncbi:hypothetical protein CDAR_242561, partial [Caerostris darwini]
VLTADVQGKLLTEPFPFLVDGVALVAAPVAAGEALEDEGVATDDARPGAVVREGLVVEQPPHLHGGGVGADLAHQPHVVVLLGLAAVLLLDQPQRHLRYVWKTKLTSVPT